MAINQKGKSLRPEVNNTTVLHAEHRQFYVDLDSYPGDSDTTDSDTYG